MPEYLAPGVFVEEVSSGNRPIEGVGTSTGAMVGRSLKGPVNQPILVTNFSQYLSMFGSYKAEYFLSYALQQFFFQGGKRCYVVRVYKNKKSPAEGENPDGVASATLAEEAKEILSIRANSPGAWGNKLRVRTGAPPLDPMDPENTAKRFNLYVEEEIEGKFQPIAGFEALSFVESTQEGLPNPGFLERVVNGANPYIEVAILDEDIIETPDSWLETREVFTVYDATGKPAYELPVKSGIDGDELSAALLEVDGETGKKLVLRVNGPDAENPAEDREIDVDVADLAKLEDVAATDFLEKPVKLEGGGAAQVGPLDFQRQEGAVIALTGGSEGAILDASDYIGRAGTKTRPATGLNAFHQVDDINIVAIPDLQAPITTGNRRDAALRGMNFCDGRADCVFLIDPAKNLSPQDVRDYKQGTGAFRGNAFASSYAGMYYPWIWISDPLTGGRKLFPPSAAAMGTYAGTDVKRGVHKAPAGTEDGKVKVAVDIEREITKGEQEILNPIGINVIRKFPGSGIVVWGARTVSSDPEWRYMNVRRLFLFLEKSIDKGTQTYVFEPNDRVLWGQIIANVSAFLRIQWSEGKLVGVKPEEAFFVKCDEETNPPESVDLGRVITVIGVAPSKPAEFVIFRISQWRPNQ